MNWPGVAGGALRVPLIGHGLGMSLALTRPVAIRAPARPSYRTPLAGGTHEGESLASTRPVSRPPANVRNIGIEQAASRLTPWLTTLIGTSRLNNYLT